MKRHRAALLARRRLILQGNALANGITGGGGNDQLDGGAGDDRLDGGAGADVMRGGAGADFYVVDDVDDRILGEGAGPEIDRVRSSVSFSLATAANVENLFTDSAAGLALTGNGLDTAINGGAGNDRLDGGAGNDTLIGGAGNDTLVGGTGVDTLRGGAGEDTYYVSDTADAILGEQAGAGTDTVYAAADYSIEGRELERLFANSDAGLTLTGNLLKNTVFGRGGNDTLYGGGGDDILNGQGGADIMEGGAGSDTYYVDRSADVIQGEQTGGGTDTVRSTVSYSIADVANVENLAAAGPAGLTLTGNALNNVLTGGVGDDTLNGGGGNDTLLGGLGDDTMRGGAGSDTYFVNTLGDVIEGELSGGGTDIVYASDSYSIALAANVERLYANTDAGVILTGNGGDNLVNGRGGADQLFGGGGSDKLTGGAGADRLDGGAGRDILTGGAGADRFVFSNVADSVNGARDVIADFSGGEDIIDLSQIDAIRMGRDGGANDAFRFIGTAAFSRSDFGGNPGELRQFTLNGDTVVEGDVNGDGKADFQVIVTGLHTFTEGDFVL